MRERSNEVIQLQWPLAGDMHKVGIRRMVLNQIGIWNLGFVKKLLNNFRSKQESHQLTQPVCDTRSSNQTQASEVKTQVSMS